MKRIFGVLVLFVFVGGCVDLQLEAVGDALGWYGDRDKEISMTNETKVVQKPVENISVEEVEVKEPEYLTVNQLQREIDRAFKVDYTFKLLPSESKSYETHMSRIDRFFIYVIKDENDYLYTYDDFSWFTERMHRKRRSDIKDANEDQLEYLRKSINYEDSKYNSTCFLKELVVDGEKVLLEKCYTLFITQFGYAITGNYDYYNIKVLCSPKMVVEIMPRESRTFSWTTLDTASAEKSMNNRMDDDEEELVLAAGRIIEICKQD